MATLSSRRLNVDHEGEISGGHTRMLRFIVSLGNVDYSLSATTIASILSVVTRFDVPMIT